MGVRTPSSVLGAHRLRHHRHPLPHWQTYVGTHVLGVPSFSSLSVDPIFPNLFRYQYDLEVDVGLAKSIHKAGVDAGLTMQMMENPDFRVDYGTITSCHLIDPEWSKPIVALSSNRGRHYYSVEVMQEMMIELGRATRTAIEASDRKVLLIASNSLSHRHFTSESEIPEDMSREHITSHAMHLWDMRMIELMRAGRSKEIIEIMPEFTEQAIAETDGGALTWLIAALDFPTEPAILHGYGTVIGTGNDRGVAHLNGDDRMNRKGTHPDHAGTLTPARTGSEPRMGSCS